jgi:Kip1 ubiquitination-promoting complex protein 1
MTFHYKKCLNSLSEPYPSVLYQSVVCEYLTSERNAAIAFLSSLLCQLNWSFSEFIGMLQEIQNSANRPQKVNSTQMLTSNKLI